MPRQLGSGRSAERRFFDSRKGFSPGITEGDLSEREWLKYERDRRLGFEATEPTSQRRGFGGVRRR